MPPLVHKSSPPPPWNIPSIESQHVGFGGSGFDREPATTMPSLGPQFPPHSTQIGIENINLEDDDEYEKEIMSLVIKLR